MSLLPQHLQKHRLLALFCLLLVAPMALTRYQTNPLLQHHGLAGLVLAGILMFPEKHLVVPVVRLGTARRVLLGFRRTLIIFRVRARTELPELVLEAEVPERLGRELALVVPELRD
jgi:hypothetical protein